MVRMGGLRQWLRQLPTMAGWMQHGGGGHPAMTQPYAEPLDVAYLILSGTTTAARAPEILAGLVALGFAQVIAIPTPNAARTIAARELAEVAGARVVESYYDLAIRPRPPFGVVLFAPCSFNSLNKLAQGIADSLALSVAAEAIGRGTPVIVGPALNQPLLDHPVAQASLHTLPSWGVIMVPPTDDGAGPRLAPTQRLLDAVRPFAPRH
jgi:phosphopantothenoylcysteine synthetase/decarboxylase